MKKLLLIVVCCFCLCGCSRNWKKDFQASNITIRTVKGLRTNTYITYSIKNTSNYTCKSMKAIVEFKSGDLIVEETIYPSVYSSSPLKPNNVLNDEYAILYKDYEGYIANFKEVDCYDKDTN